MAGGVNKVILLGNLGKDPEIRVLENNVKKASFPLATSEIIKDRNTGEKRTDTEWHNIVMWRSLAEVAEKYLKKGNQVYVEGKIKSRSYTDRDGNTRYITEIVAENFVMLSRNESSKGNSSEQGTDTGTIMDKDTGDLPF